MERVQVLIDKLVQQKQQNDSAAQMLLTVQLLQNELVQLQHQKETKSTAKVAVVMPSRPYNIPQEATAVKAAEFNTTLQEKPVQPEVPPVKEVPVPVSVAPAEEPPAVVMPLAEAHKVPEMPQEVEEPRPAASQKDLFGNDVYTLKRPAVTLQEEAVEKQPEVKPESVPAATVRPAEPETQPFDAVWETPTLVQHLPPQNEGPKEINQVVSSPQLSLNDRLKQEKTELAQKLKETPVKDLRKAIGINDKFLFVSELFRGDEAMYERSIKTINSFHVLQEAEYWMNRELKVKLGWNDTKDTVQHFYHLVRRRFS